MTDILSLWHDANEAEPALKSRMKVLDYQVLLRRARIIDQAARDDRVRLACLSAEIERELARRNTIWIDWLTGTRIELPECDLIYLPRRVN